MLYNSGTKLTAGDAHGMLTVINDYLFQGGELTEGMKTIITGLKDKGFNIEQRENGTYGLVIKK